MTNRCCGRGILASNQDTVYSNLWLPEVTGHDVFATKRLDPVFEQPGERLRNGNVSELWYSDEPNCSQYLDGLDGVFLGVGETSDLPSSKDGFTAGIDSTNESSNRSLISHIGRLGVKLNERTRVRGKLQT